ncbi:MAG: hypothetical protein KIS67_13210 [Verrucomicrobiae bacterium]|nr:hypothetical protein [Verrucomicrobiae bacterium]
MKAYTIAILAVTAALTLVAGCSKQDSSSPANPVETEKTAGSLADQLQDTAEAAKASAEKAAGEVAKQAETAATAASGTAQTLIDKARGLVAEKKYQDALTVLGQLSDLKLTDDQKKLVESLKTQIQKALAGQAATDGASAVGNLLGGKK